MHEKYTNEYNAQSLDDGFIYIAPEKKTGLDSLYDLYYHRVEAERAADNAAVASEKGESNMSIATDEEVIIEEKKSKKRRNLEDAREESSQLEEMLEKKRLEKQKKVKRKYL